MATEALNDKQQTFIKLVSKGMDFKRAYATACNLNATSKSSKSQGSRWAKRFATQIDDTKKLVLTAKDKAIVDEVVRETVKDILDQAQVDKRLCDIITGNLELEDTRQNIFTKQLETVKRKPNVTETLKAIAEYNKRFGAYTAEKKEVEVKVLNMTPEEARAIAAALEDEI